MDSLGSQGAMDSLSGILMRPAESLTYEGSATYLEV